MFSGYFQPTEEEFKALWDAGTFVLDANVLLDLYRLPESSRADMFGVIERIQDRVWIPYQFALEFFRNRLSVISETDSAADEVMSALSSQLSDVTKSLNKTGLDIDVDQHLSGLRSAIEDLRNAIEKAKRAKDISHANDPVRDKLFDLLKDKIGPAPTVEDMKSMTEDADRRYQNRVPPGFKDVDKDKHPDGPIFVHKGVEYRRRLGDLIAWKQIIKQVTEANLSKLVIVTSDQKEDWWWKEKGRTIGPLPELVQEISSQTPVETFYMYSLPRFLEYSKQYLNTTVSTATIDDAEKLEANTTVLLESVKSSFFDRIHKGIFDFLSARFLDLKYLSPPSEGIMTFTSRYDYVVARYAPTPLDMIRSFDGIDAAIKKIGPTYVGGVKVSPHIFMLVSNSVLSEHLDLLALSKALKRSHLTNMGEFSAVYVATYGPEGFAVIAEA